MKIPYLLVNFLCVFIPVFGLDVWKIRREKSSHKPYMSQPMIALFSLVSAVTCTLFSFSISRGVHVDLSMVCLTLAFLLLPWTLGLLVVALYAISEIILSIFELGHGILEIQVVHQVLVEVSSGLILLSIYVLMMCVCSAVVRKYNFTLRGVGFVLGMVCYTLVNYVYARHVYHFQQFNVSHFAVFILVLNLTFIIAVRLLVAGHNAHVKRQDEVRIEKLELISQLSASVAHEIRNPLTVVRGYTKLMMNEDFERAKSVEFLTNMLYELDRAESVISDYLQLAKRRDDVTDAQVELSQVVNHVVDVLTPYAVNKSIELKRTIEAGIHVYGNHAHVTQAMMNLVKNAIEANDDTGTVEVSLIKTSNWVELKVTDTGKGIAESMMTRLGEPYYSTKTQGTGLGLTLVYKVIHDIHGKIQVKIKEGVGTTFKVHLPVYSLEEDMSRSTSIG